jgi:hypothetical protein
MGFLKGLTALVLLVLVAFAVAEAKGTQAGNEARDVGTAGVRQHGQPAGVPRNPTNVNGTTDPDGEIWLDVRQTVRGERNMTDLHFKITRPRDAKISNLDTARSGGTPFEDHSPKEGVDDPSEKAEADVGNGSDVAGAGDVITAKLKVVDKDGNPYEGKVNFEVWWTRAGEIVSDLCPDKFGEDAVLSVGDVLPGGVVTGTVDVVESTQAAEINAVTLGECYGYRFQNGDFVLGVNQGARFALTQETEVRAYNENSTDVTNTMAFTATNLRIDDAGNFVFNIERDQEDSEHIVIVIIGLDVENIEAMSVGTIVSSKISGSAISGICGHDIHPLVSIIEAE